MLNPDAQLDPQKVEELANTAALKYSTEGVPLSKAVFLATGGQSITLEHLKRILRGANVKAYLLAYDKADPSNRVINFEGGLAKLEEILAMMEKDTDSPVKIAADDSLEDFTTEPFDYKLGKLAEDLKITRVEEIKPDAPKVSRSDVYLMIKHAEDRVAGDIIHLTNTYNDLLQGFRNIVKQAVLEDYSLGDIIRAVSDKPDEALTEEVIKVAHSLPTKFWTDEEITKSLEKKSSVNPDPQNTLRLTWAKVAECGKVKAIKENAKTFLAEKKASVLKMVRKENT